MGSDSCLMMSIAANNKDDSIAKMKILDEPDIPVTFELFNRNPLIFFISTKMLKNLLRLMFYFSQNIPLL